MKIKEIRRGEERKEEKETRRKKDRSKRRREIKDKFGRGLVVVSVFSRG